MAERRYLIGETFLTNQNVVINSHVIIPKGSLFTIVDVKELDYVINVDGFKIEDGYSMSGEYIDVIRCSAMVGDY